MIKLTSFNFLNRIIAFLAILLHVSLLVNAVTYSGETVFENEYLNSTFVLNGTECTIRADSLRIWSQISDSVLMYDFHNASVSDLSGQGNDGTLYNMGTHDGTLSGLGGNDGTMVNMGVLDGVDNGNVSFIEGSYGDASEFDGVDDSIILEPTAFNISGGRDFSIGFWAKPYTTPPSGYAENLISFRYANLRGIGFQVESNGYVKFMMRDESGTSTINPLESHMDVWTYYAGVYEGSTNTMYYYIDGELQGSTTGKSISETILYSTIGGNANIAGNKYRYNGSIDEVRVWKTVLNQTQIEEEMNSSVPVNTPQLVASYSFERNFNDTSYYVDGYHGTGFRFNGTAGTVNVPDHDTLDITESITLSAWVKPDSVGVTSGSRIINKGGIYYLQLPQGSTRVDFGTTGLSDDYLAGTGTDLTLNEWSYVTGVYNGSHKIIYVNGVEIISEPATGSLGVGVSDVDISSTGGSSRFFNGTIDEVRIWSIALNQTQIEEEMNSSYPINPYGIVLDYGFESVEEVNDTSYFIDGSHGKAYYFDGVDDYILSPDITLGNKQTYTGWFNSEDTSGASIMMMYLFSAEPGMRVELQSNGQLLTYFLNSSGDYNTVGSNTVGLNDGTWHHFGLVFDEGEVDLYVDGVLDKNQVIDVTTINNTDHIIVGAYKSTGGRFIQGSLDEIRVWNRALNSTEIEEDMNSFVPVGGSAIISYSFDSPNDVNDTSYKVLGKRDEALNFDGVDDYVSIPDSAEIELTEFSLSLWAKGTNPSTQEYFFNKDGKNGYALYKNSADSIIAYVGNNYFGTGQSFDYNTWNHLVLIKNISGAYFYYNGDYVSMDSSSTPSYSSQDLRIGQNNSDDYFTGSLDEFRIYNYSLSTQEIEDLYNLQKGYIHFENVSFHQGDVGVYFDEYKQNTTNTSIDMCTTYPFEVSSTDGQLNVGSYFDYTFNGTMILHSVGYPVEIVYTSANGTYNKTYARQNFTWDATNYESTLLLTGLESEPSGNLFTFYYSDTGSGGGGGSSGGGSSGGGSSGGGDEDMINNVTFPRSGGGGGGGGSQIIIINNTNDGKAVCDIRFVPQHIYINDTQKLVNLQIANFENNTVIAPSIRFEHESGTRMLTDSLRVTNVPSFINVRSVGELGVRLSNLIIVKGNATAYLVVSTTQCKDMKVPIDINIDNPNPLGEFVEKVQNQTLEEIIVDAFDTRIFTAGNDVDFDSLPVWKQMLYKLDTVGGYTFLIMLIIAILLLPIGDYRRIVEANIFLDIVARILLVLIIGVLAYFGLNIFVIAIS